LTTLRLLMDEKKWKKVKTFNNFNIQKSEILKTSISKIQ
jgi:hypothetical protein